MFGAKLQVIGLHFINGTQTRQSYTQFLKDELGNRKCTLSYRLRLQYQHDKFLTHFLRTATQVLEWLDWTQRVNIMASSFARSHIPRFLLVGYIKGKGLRKHAYNTKRYEKTHRIRPEVIERAIQFIHRLITVQERHIEHLN